jgi:hypothetical protein
MDTEWTKVSKIECLGEIDDYVYDLSIEDNDPFFFANDLLVHNTDSCYFSAYSILKPKIDSNELEWSKELCIQLYDTIGENVNASFPDFMKRAFNAPHKNGSIIKAGRELIGDRALFITKKKYSINIFDKEGKRLDTNGSAGKMKIMGLEIKRSDTPKVVQDFLYRVLEMVLVEGKPKEDVVEYIISFKNEFSKNPSWLKGSPKAANNLTHYTELEKKLGKANMPGHIRASMNWNYLRNVYKDNYSLSIVDGMKVVVCKLKENQLGFTSIAYPVDETRLPEWFTTLSFDDSSMEKVLIDEKIDNLIGILDWNLRSDTDTTNNFSSLFSFE